MRLFVCLFLLNKGVFCSYTLVKCVKKKRIAEKMNKQTNKQINLKWNIISGKVMSLIVVHLSGLIFKGLFRLTYIPLCHLYITGASFVKLLRLPSKYSRSLSLFHFLAILLIPLPSVSTIYDK